MKWTADPRRGTFSPLRSALIRLAARAARSAYGEDVEEIEAKTRKLRAIELRKLADSIGALS